MQSGVPIVNFPDFSANDKSPWASALQGALQGYGNMQQLQQQKYDNQIKAAQAQYAPQMAQATLAHEQAQGPYLQAQTTYQNAISQGVPSEIAQRMAQAHLDQQQSQEIAYKLAHPSLYQTPEVQTMQYMMVLGKGGSPAMGSTNGMPGNMSGNPVNGSQSTPSGLPYTQIGQNNAPISNFGGSNYLAGNTGSTQSSPTDSSSNLIEGTNIPSTGNPYADAFIQNKLTTPEQRSTIAAHKQQQMLENKNAADEQKAEFQDMPNLLKIVQEADNFDASYKKAHRTGSAQGTWPSSGWTTAIPGRDFSNDQKADTSAMNLQALMAKTLSSHMSNMLFNAAGGMKLQRSLDSNAETDNYNKIKAQALRGLQLIKFRQTANKLGINDYNSQNSLWASYNLDNPSYDPKTGKINQDNLSDNSINNYLSKQKSNNSSLATTNNSSVNNQANPMPVPKNIDPSKLPEGVYQGYIVDKKTGKTKVKMSTGWVNYD